MANAPSLHGLLTDLPGHALRRVRRGRSELCIPQSPSAGVLMSKKSAALLAAIKEYDANKWKVIGQKVGKPAKVRLCRRWAKRNTGANVQQACEQYAKENFGGKY